MAYSVHVSLIFLLLPIQAFLHPVNGWGRIHIVELPRHLTRAEADTLVTSCISEGVSASVSAEYNTPKFVDNPKYVLAPMTKSHNLAVLRNMFEISYVMLFQYLLAR